MRLTTMTDYDQYTLTSHCPPASVLGCAMQGFMAHLDGLTLADLLPDTDLPMTDGRRMKVERRRLA